MSADAMEWRIFLGGSIVRILGKQEELFEDPGILEPFVTNSLMWDQEIRCSVTDTLEEPEGKLVFSDPGRRVYASGDTYISYIGGVEKSLDGAYIRVERSGSQRCAQFCRKEIRDKIPAKAVLTAMEAEHLVTEKAGILLHAACISHEGQAIAFTAPSGTGKSTQAELWKQYRDAEIINGDRIMIRVEKDSCEAIGIPFCGSSGICKNRTLPLKAIVYLSQGKDNDLKRLTGVGAFRRIWEGCSLHTWNREDVAQTADTVQKLLQMVPVYHLSCTPDERAVKVLEAALRK